MSPSNNLNEKLRKWTGLIDRFSGARLSELRELNYDWQANTLDETAKLFPELQNSELSRETVANTELTDSGRLFLSRILVDFSSLLQESKKELGNYILHKAIAIGKNSAIFAASHKLLRNEVALKIIRPGAAPNLIECLQTISRLPSSSNVLRPIDVFDAKISDIFGRNLLVQCVVFPRASGITLKEFLSQKNYQLNSHVVLSFVKQVGGALQELEKIGAYHGDLHYENILVGESSSGQLEFTLIDVSFGSMGSLTREECHNSDLEHFRQHIWRILSLQKSFIPRMSLRKFLGTKQYIAITKILLREVNSFRQIMATVFDDTEYQSYLSRKRLFLSEHFKQPTTFRLQRFEEIIDPSVAARLFVPFAELMGKVKEFSNAFVSGNRGSGKSTYLASLAFFPSTIDPIVSYQVIFGIYFPCRQGEFKSLLPNEHLSPKEAQNRTTEIILIKVIRRTLEALSSGIDSGRLTQPNDYGQLKTFLSKYAGQPGIVSVDSEILTEIRNLVSTMTRVEMELIASFHSPPSATRPQAELSDLIDFFTIVRTIFTELSATRFHILFDDAGAPNTPPGVQKVLCDLILTSNPIFCIKFSAEKFTFTFESSHGKVPENGHDYFEHDISYVLFIGSSTARLRRSELERYFHAIVRQRLEHFGYRSGDIIDYLGDSPTIEDMLIGLLASRRKDARYTGWTAVWNIADRTPRNLLEIVSEIFAYGGVTTETKPFRINSKDQDRAIRTISDKRLQSLSQVAGYIRIGNKKLSVGRLLFEITASIGAVFRAYLREEVGKKRKRQHLAIERNDLEVLSREANEVLQKLISFGVLDDSKAEHARDDVVKKPIYILNRVYCPTFGILWRRDEHLRLSRAKFELLLLDPESFVRSGTKRLAKAHNELSDVGGLFGYEIYD